MAESEHDRWLEIIGAVVLALATIASAWSAYQATRWGGVMSIRFSEASAARIEYTTLNERADQKTAIDVGLFTNWVDAVAAGEDDLADFQRERFRDEFKPAFAAWIAQDPLENEDATESPFDMDEYRVAERAEAAQQHQLAERRATQARTANQRGDNYVLTTVLFASVLFFAGISSKLRSRLSSDAMIGLGIVAFLAGSVLLVSFPVH